MTLINGYADLNHPVRTLALSSDRMLLLWSATQFASPLRRMAAYYELVALVGLHPYPARLQDRRLAAHGGDPRASEKTVLSDALLHAAALLAARAAGNEPRVLLVAPMSGHFATLMRGTIRTLLRDHVVYVTDWRNTRDISVG